uniref:Caveolin n=1 Tax=Meloidogyne javanica TaxID=6303 RepID=A0A915MTJ6_MELJA
MASVEMQEQIPLKSAEHPQPEGGAESAAGAQQNATTDGSGNPTIENNKKEKKGGWFSSKKKAANAKTTEIAATGQEGDKNTTEGGEDGGNATDGANNVNEKKQKTKSTSGKKCPFSFCRPQRGVAGTDGGASDGTLQQQPSFQLNMVQRDDRKLQEGIDFGFEQIFGEPDAVHSINGVWRTTITVFLAVRNFIYKLFSLIFAVPLAILFGILFALISVLGVYFFVPIGRLLSIPLGWLAKVWSTVIGAILDPVCRSCGLLFGNVKVSRYGINHDPTAVISA